MSGYMFMQIYVSFINVREPEHLFYRLRRRLKI